MGSSLLHLLAENPGLVAQEDHDRHDQRDHDRHGEQRPDHSGFLVACVAHISRSR